MLKADLTSAGKQLAISKVQSGEFPGSGPQSSEYANYTYTSNGEAYCLTASSPRIDELYHITQDGNIRDGACEGHVLDPSAFTFITAGDAHACGIAGGKAYCWGDNGNGKLGDGTATVRSSPVAVDTSIMNGAVTAISAGPTHTCAVAGGKAYCWGSGTQGRLGDNAAVARNSPVAVDTSIMNGTVSSVAVGLNHSCAIADGLAYCWGQNTSGTIGIGTTVSPQLIPVAVNTDNLNGTVTALSAGGSRSCAVTGGKAYCWGAGTYGGLGHGALTSYSAPHPVNTSIMNGTVTDISVGDSHVCAIADNKAYCWGYGAGGRIGDAAGATRNSPVAVSTSVMSGNVTALSAGSLHSCAIAAGQVYCWGSGTYGALGYGATSLQSSPIAVNTTLMNTTVSAVAVGASRSCGLSSGVVYCWGRAASGALGNGTTTGDQSTPVRVEPIPAL